MGQLLINSTTKPQLISGLSFTIALVQ